MELLSRPLTAVHHFRRMQCGFDWLFTGFSTDCGGWLEVILLSLFMSHLILLNFNLYFCIILIRIKGLK